MTIRQNIVETGHTDFCDFFFVRMFVITPILEQYSEIAFLKIKFTDRIKKSMVEFFF